LGVRIESLPDGKGVRETLERVMDPTADERFTRLYEEHYPAVLAYCVRRVNRSEAEDVASDVFAVLWRKMDSFEPEFPLPWLYRVAHGQIRNRRRAIGRAAALVQRLRLHGPGHQPPADVMIVRSDHDSRVHEALDGLRWSDQEVLRLSIWEEMAAKDIGLVMGCSASAAEQRLHRAKKRLAARFPPSLPFRSHLSPQRLEEGGRP
jgi:RNA polymerase sigma-70 factor (ECF subfamily)